jgi:hypothetical protein
MALSYAGPAPGTSTGIDTPSWMGILAPPPSQPGRYEPPVSAAIAATAHDAPRPVVEQRYVIALALGIVVLAILLVLIFILTK